jgi:seryl-tRNA synthetase
LLDIELFRNKLDKIIESEKKRFKDPSNAKKVTELDVKWRECLKKVEDLNRKRKELSMQIGELAKTGQTANINHLKEEAKKIKEKIDLLKTERDNYLLERDKYRYMVGNILHASVPKAETEEGNEIIRSVGKLPNFNFKPASHVELIESIDGADTSKASQISGSRFFFLKGDIVLLNLALLRFALDKLINLGYLPMWTPFFLKYDIIEAAAELADFEEQLYKIQDEDLYMIATSEQSIAAYHYDEIIDPSRLPMKYAGISSCFRREVGSHGKDTLGIFRVHQFEKVEQFIFCKPNESWNLLEELLSNAESIFKELEIPYRIVNIASGELNDNAAKKYDLEGWFPASENYRELVSCSNCTDYQARKLKIRMGTVGSQEDKEMVHTLNSTAIAVERTICCILENNQNKDHSINIPTALQKYMNGKKIINAIILE